jgi:hypothetical protein
MNLNSENIELQSSWDVLNLTDYTNGTHYSFDANYLHTDSDSFTQGEHLIQVGFFAQNTFHNSQSLFLSFGMKTILTEDYIALALGGKAKYILDLGVDVPPSSINAEISFAPSLLSFIDADSYMDFRLEADMEIIPNILIYGGYRHIDTEYIQYSETLNDNFYAGMKITF